MRLVRYCSFILFLIFTLVLIFRRDDITLKPWITEQKLEKIGGINSNGKLTAIIADSAETVVVLNNKNEFLYKLNADLKSSFVSAGFVEFDNKNNLYVYDKFFGGAFEENTERVIKFSPSGIFQGYVYSYSYRNMDFITTTGKIRAITSFGDYLYIVRVERDSFVLERVSSNFSSEEHEQVFYRYPNAFRDLYSCEIDADNYQIVWTTKARNVLYFNLYGEFLHEITNADDTDFLIKSAEEFNIDSYTWSKSGLFFRWFVFVILMVNLIIFISLLGLGLIFLPKLKLSSIYKKIIIVSVFIILGSAVFFTVVRKSIENQYVKNTYNELENIIRLISASIDSDVITSLNTRSQFNDEEYLEFCGYLRKVFSEMRFEGKQVYLIIWMERGGVVYSMYDLEYAWGLFYIWGDYKDSFLEYIYNTGNFNPSIVKDTAGTWISNAGPMFDKDDKIVASIEIGYNIRSVEEAERTLMIQVAVIVLSVSAAFFLFLVAFILMFDAHRKNKIKSNFLANMSHEMRTPMNAILGITEIQMRDKNLTIDTVKALGKIYESGDLLLNIINDILDLSKIEAGKMEIIPMRYDMPSLINDTAQLNRLRYENEPIVFSITVDPKTPYNLLGDELRIKQVLNNILSNAFKYTDEGSIDLSVSYEQNSRTDADDILINFRISDTGQGMTDKQIGKLFDEYERFNAEANREITGTGLGMSITKRLVDLMKGNIYIQSEANKGTVFTVSIPQRRIGNEICGDDIATKLRNFSFQSTAINNKTMFLREYMPYGSVLVVDDVESNIFVSKGMLAPYGLKVDAVSSGFAAIDKIKEGNVYDIIFMDHMMPKMDGIEAVKIIRAMDYKGSIVALTANALIGRAEMFMSSGFNGFISKPIDSRELNLILNDFIRNRKPPEVVEEARQMQREGKTDTITDSEQRLIMAVIKDCENALNVLGDMRIKINELSEEERTLFVITVHGLKSAFLNIDERELSALAKKLEFAGKDNNIDLLMKETPKLIEGLKSLVSKYKQEEDNEITSEDAAFLREKLTLVKTACEKVEKDIIHDALEALIERREWPKHIYFVLDEIAAHVLHSNYDKALAAADNFISRASPTRGLNAW